LPNFLAATYITLAIFGLFGISWKAIDDGIEEKYPQVEFISSDELNARYQNTASAFPYLFDVRENSEFEISHLKTAVNLSSADKIAKIVTEKNAEVIVYCSVGYRSAGVADELRLMGYRKVRNLRHSIFEWANKDYPLLNKYGTTNYVFSTILPLTFPAFRSLKASFTLDRGLSSISIGSILPSLTNFINSPISARLAT
jgi:rhodanese-related sulfurtransferase